MSSKKLRASLASDDASSIGTEETPPTTVVSFPCLDEVTNTTASKKVVKKPSKKSSRKEKKKEKPQDVLCQKMDQLSLAEGSIPFKWYIEQDGSKEAPWIVKVNSKRPEASGGIFDIHYVPNMLKGNYRRNGYEIRVEMFPMDEDEWEATIPGKEDLGDYHDQFGHRCVLVKGTSAAFARALDIHLFLNPV